jgi:hypothetical protein
LNSQSLWDFLFHNDHTRWCSNLWKANFKIAPRITKTKSWNLGRKKKKMFLMKIQHIGGQLQGW